MIAVNVLQQMIKEVLWMEAETKSVNAPRHPHVEAESDVFNASAEGLVVFENATVQPALQ